MFGGRKKRTVTFFMNVRFPTAFLAANYEKQVEAYLAARKLGEIDGHGALFSPDHTEVLSADFSIELNQDDPDAIAEIIDILEEAGAPLGCTWSYDDQPETRTFFGTLDALMIRFEGVPEDGHAEFEDFLQEVLDEFHEAHRTTAGFQGVWMTAKKVTVSLHGFEYDDMERWLNDILTRRNPPYRWSFERTSPRYEDLFPDGSG